MIPTSKSYTISTSQTGYESDQTINPSELNLWRVIKINSDKTIEMVSEYVSSTNIYFTSQTGYLNFVGTLNLIAKQYENSKYTVGSRYIGFNGQTELLDATSVKFTNPAPWTSTTSSNSNETIGGGDVMYEYDAKTYTGLVYKTLGTLKANKVETTTATTYWLGSRNYFYNQPDWYNWSGRTINESGSISGYKMYEYSYGWNESSVQAAIRPIVTLHANITSYSGSGTSASPWVLS